MVFIINNNEFNSIKSMEGYVMITQIILRFEDLPDEQRTEICHNLLSEMRYEDLDFKLFYKNGGINKPMIEVTNDK